MKIAVIGATGRIGKHVVLEAARRGHEVLGISRPGSQQSNSNVPTLALDIFSSVDISMLLAQNDALIIAYRAPANELQLQAELARVISTAAHDRSECHCVFIGAVSSLEVTEGVKYIESPDFPADLKGRAIAHEQAVNVLRLSSSENWTVVSPPENIGPSASLGKEGSYRSAIGQLLRDPNGASAISFADFARAVVDEAVDGQHLRNVVGVAY